MNVQRGKMVLLVSQRFAFLCSNMKIGFFYFHFKSYCHCSDCTQALHLDSDRRNFNTFSYNNLFVVIFHPTMQECFSLSFTYFFISQNKMKKVTIENCFFGCARFSLNYNGSRQNYTNS